jgi:hypothetical protein
MDVIIDVDTAICMKYEIVDSFSRMVNLRRGRRDEERRRDDRGTETGNREY